MSAATSPTDASADGVGDRRHTEHGKERKQQLIDAAADLFAANGYAATRIEDICRRAGVAKGLFYWYFPTKQELFAGSLVRTMRLRLRKAQATAMDDDADPLTRLRQGAEASVRFHAEHAGYFSLLDVERADATHAELLREGSAVYLADVVALVRAAQQDGLVGDDPAEALAVGVLGAVSSFTHAWRDHRIAMDAETLATFVGAWVERALLSRLVRSEDSARSAVSPGGEDHF